MLLSDIVMNTFKVYFPFPAIILKTQYGIVLTCCNQACHIGFNKRFIFRLWFCWGFVNFKWMWWQTKILLPDIVMDTFKVYFPFPAITLKTHYGIHVVLTCCNQACHIGFIKPFILRLCFRGCFVNFKCMWWQTKILLPDIVMDTFKVYFPFPATTLKTHYGITLLVCSKSINIAP